jgi:hypothetical protein
MASLPFTTKNIELVIEDIEVFSQAALIITKLTGGK